MRSKPSLIFLASVIVSCAGTPVPHDNGKSSQVIAAAGKDENPFATVADIPAPENFHRVKRDSASFGHWLQQVALKKNKTVFIYNGSKKVNQSAQFAVLDISVGNKNLQQCADAVMRLRAEYLFARKQYGDIVFTDNERHAYRFEPPYSRDNFNRYLEKVFSWCGSASLEKQLHAVNDPAAIAPGDVLIRGGFPGHAVIVMDVVENDEGRRMYLLAQSYMPAQDIHILQNPSNTSVSPWYAMNNEELIVTPEYVFHRDQLRRW